MRSIWRNEIQLLDIFVIKMATARRNMSKAWYPWLENTFIEWAAQKRYTTVHHSAIFTMHILSQLLIPNLIIFFSATLLCNCSVNLRAFLSEVTYGLYFQVSLNLFLILSLQFCTTRHIFNFTHRKFFSRDSIICYF